MSLRGEDRVRHGSSSTASSMCKRQTLGSTPPLICNLNVLDFAHTTTTTTMDNIAAARKESWRNKRKRKPNTQQQHKHKQSEENSVPRLKKTNPAGIKATPVASKMKMAAKSIDNKHRHGQANSMSKERSKQLSTNSTTNTVTFKKKNRKRKKVRSSNVEQSKSNEATPLTPTTEKLTSSDTNSSKVKHSATTKRTINHKKNKMNHYNKKKTDEIWFDDVDPCLIRSSQLNNAASHRKGNGLVKTNSSTGLTKYIAMDCEMVGTGHNGTVSMLARVSLVNLYGHCIYDKFVAPMDDVTDYRTPVSGIRPENLVNAEDFKVVQQEVFKILENRILVGHSVHYDLKVLFLSHPRHMTRDTCEFFRRFFNRQRPSLRKLSETYLGVKIQDGEHDSVTDAQATMRLFTLFKKQWEPEVRKRFRGKNLTHKTHLV